jgi:hypothetical protein
MADKEEEQLSMHQLKKAMFRPMNVRGSGAARRVVLWAAIAGLALLAGNADAQSRRERPPQIRRAEWLSWLHPVLDGLGDRYERPGTERMVLSGVIRWGQASSDVPIQMTLVFPERLSIRVTSTPDVDIDRGRAAVQLTEEQFRLADSLLGASADHFFAARHYRAAVRPIGQGFRFTSPGSPLSGRNFDLYELTEVSALRDQPRRVVRLFYFDSAGHRLALVWSTLDQNGTRVNVETEYGGWQLSQGQTVPGRITRRENGDEVFTITIQNAAFQSAAEPLR